MRLTNQLITQVVIVPELENNLLRYDRIRWYRSVTGQNGLFEAVTSAAPEPAMLRAQQLYRTLTDRAFGLRVDGGPEQQLVFTGPDPVSVDQAAAQLNQSMVGIQATADGEVLTIASLTTGTGSTLELLDSEAVPLLGFSVGDCASGTEADSVLLSGINEYRIDDQQSSPEAFYTIEYRSSFSPVTSPRSASFQSRQREAVPLDGLIGAYIRLCDLQGRPLGGRRVYLHNTFLPNRAVGDGKMWGLFREYEEIVTDKNGYASIFLVRGAQIDVTVAGSGFTRRIRIPLEGSIVNLLDPYLETRDEFGIQRPNIDFAIRTS